MENGKGECVKDTTSWQKSSTTTWTFVSQFMQFWYNKTKLHVLYIIESLEYNAHVNTVHILIFELAFVLMGPETILIWR